MPSTMLQGFLAQLRNGSVSPNERLPTFGGRPPLNPTWPVLSWDPTHLLVETGPGVYELLPRPSLTDHTRARLRAAGARRRTDLAHVDARTTLARIGVQVGFADEALVDAALEEMRAGQRDRK